MNARLSLLLALTAAAAAVACSSDRGGSRSLPAYNTADDCAAHTDDDACTAAGCNWYALGMPCPAGVECPGGVCQSPDPCGDSTDERSCVAAGCQWTDLTNVELCVPGPDGNCLDGLCHPPEECGCICPLYCPQGDDCACSCPPGGGSGCACECPPCQPGQECAPCECACPEDPTPTDPPEQEDPCTSHADEETCLADPICTWFGIGAPCRLGEPCLSGVCQLTHFDECDAVGDPPPLG